jgi:hypothetical protein
MDYMIPTNSVPGLLVLVVTLLVLAGFGLTGQFLSILRHSHSEVWRSLGSPTLFLNNSISNGLQVLRFLWRSEYRSLGDERLTRIAAAMKITFVVYSLALAAVILVQL